MCGIAGVFMREGEASPDVLDKLAGALAHRGPDEQGHFRRDRIGLAHTRLSIIDVAHGHQPFVSPAGTVLIANGEIYNDLDLRIELAGTPFRTASDCEPPLYLYERFGETFARKLRGMYAIAIYDPAASRLTLSRDRFGIKQIYYADTPAFFAFASEPAALVAAGLVAPGVDEVHRAELLQMQFTAGETTIFPGIRRVRPGETLVVEDGRLVRRVTTDAMPPKTASIDEAQALDQLGILLTETTSAHMRSEVPYGLFLSGGIDSAALMVAMTAVTSQPIVALTAAFPDAPSKDESLKARTVAKALKADHHIVELRAEDFFRDLPALAAALDDPTTDASALPLFMLAREARRLGLKVALSGEGADELFGGYKRYRRSLWLGGLWREKTRTRGIIERSPSSPAPFARWRDGIAEVERTETGAGRTGMQRLQDIDCQAWLPNDLLLKLDRCLMAHGVEGRTPYLDNRLSPFAYALPNSLKVRGRYGKWLLREWLARHLPAADPWGRKQGFVVPAGKWLNQYRAAIEPLLTRHPAIAAMGLSHRIAGVFEDEKKGQAGWNLLFYALWHSRHVLGVDSRGTIEDVLAASLIA
jgi:asparagine synthase (glutamine-hydrolysing)